MQFAHVQRLTKVAAPLAIVVCGIWTAPAQALVRVLVPTVAPKRQTAHTLATAALTANVFPEVFNERVRFQVAKGPDASPAPPGTCEIPDTLGEANVCMTDEHGNARWSYNGVGAGTDTVMASAWNGGLGITWGPVAKATVSWKTTSYVALGDSYSAGEGGGDYLPNSDLPNNHCDRSPHAYGPLLDAARQPGSFAFVACSGAVTRDLVNPNAEGNIDPNTSGPEAPQLDALRPATTIATLTIGGNDIGFSELAQRCLFGRFGFFFKWGNPGCAADTTFVAKLDARIHAFAGNGTALSAAGEPIEPILALLLAAHSRAPQAAFYVLGYPRLFGSFRGECGVGTIYANNVPILGYASVAVKILSKDAKWVNTIVDEIDNALKTATREAKVLTGGSFTYVTPEKSFASHRLCDTGPSWIKPLSANADYNDPSTLTDLDPGSLHPTLDGQQLGYEAALLATKAQF
jgi:GDSL-like Lipase/Acylhydrolase family